MSSAPPAPPEGFRSPAFLRAHAHSVLCFWGASRAPRSGGFFHCLRDDGSVYDARTRHLVSSTRLVVQFAWAVVHALPPPPPPQPGWRAQLDSCVRFLRERHFARATGGWRWIVHVDGDEEAAAPAAAPAEPEDDAHRSYGLCFVLLAFAWAARAGVAGARAAIDDVTATLMERFWEPAHGLYADEASADWAARSPYRGQNANMHAVEAHMAAFGATLDGAHLARARTIAHAMCVRQAARVAAACAVRRTRERAKSTRERARRAQERAP
jgi:mannose/cellobiose epimerase-like protein (N-acyl-D-glucosamine 2-epimerase family)